MKAYRIVIADDHALIRQGVKRMIEESADQVIGEVGDGLALLDFLKETPADLIVLDISMPNLRGLEAIREVRKICPEVKILILTMHKSEKYLCFALSEGANGYLLKEDSDAELLPAIEKIKAGGIFISPHFAASFPEERIASCTEGNKLPKDTLTLRERQVITLIVEGVTSKEIAEILNISKRTVEHHRANMMRKLGINNVTDLIKYAMSKGYMSSPAE